MFRILCGKLYNVYKSNKTTLRILRVYVIVLAIVSSVFYSLIPLILNYPKDTVGGKFQMELEHANYGSQYILITLSILLGISVVMFFLLHRVNNWQKYIDRTDEDSIKEIEYIRNKCISLPYICYVIQIIIPSLMIVGIHAYTTKLISIMTTIKIFIIFFSFITLAAVFTYIFTKRIFTEILLKTFNDSIEPNIRISFRKNIYLQLIPTFIVALLFTSLIGYSRLVNEKGNLIHKIYQSSLSNIFTDKNYVKSVDDIKNEFKEFKLENVKDCIFVIKPNTKQAIDLNNMPLNLSPFFLKYLNELAFNDDNNGHVFDYYGVDSQGAAIRLNTISGNWIIGIRYEVASNGTLTFFIISFIILLFANIIVLSYFAGTLAEDVSRVANNLTDIAQGEIVHLDKKLAVTSSDEISDLVIAFNKILDREQENIKSIKENQAILLEQERLASLGQLIGGIAHNLKTPIMSIAGGIEALKDLVLEYRDSIDDKSVTEQDHKEIARDMLVWLEKMKPYCAYMSDVISAVKGQAVQMNTSNTVKFTVDELMKRVDLLLKHELKKYHCLLKVDSHIDMSTEIKGEINNLVQVFDNIIINAMESYEGKTGIIDMAIVRSGDNIEFIFKDYGKGIPKNVADRLFKEMITTKGKNGTGLGLYMSYSTIKGRFGGNMSFSSKEGVGTTFMISIPCITYSNKEVG